MGLKVRHIWKTCQPYFCLFGGTFLNIKGFWLVAHLSLPTNQKSLRFEKVTKMARIWHDLSWRVFWYIILATTGKSPILLILLSQEQKLSYHIFSFRLHASMNTMIYIIAWTQSSFFGIVLDLKKKLRDKKVWSTFHHVMNYVKHNTI